MLIVRNEIVSQYPVLEPDVQVAVKRARVKLHRICWNWHVSNRQPPEFVSVLVVTTKMKLHTKLLQCKNIRLLQHVFQLSQLHVCGIHIMKFKDCFQSSEDLEIKTLRSFSSVFFFRTPINYHFWITWLHSYGRKASSVAMQIGLPSKRRSYIN